MFVVHTMKDTSGDCVVDLEVALVEPLKLKITGGPMRLGAVNVVLPDLELEVKPNPRLPVEVEVYLGLLGREGKWFQYQTVRGAQRKLGTDAHLFQALACTVPAGCVTLEHGVEVKLWRIEGARAEASV